MKILRLTRHDASTAQIAELTRIFGEVEVTKVSETLPASPREAVARFNQLTEGVDVVEAVLPVNLLEAVLKFSDFAKSGGMIIKAETERKLDDNGGVSFDFKHYIKMIKVEVVSEKLL